MNAPIGPEPGPENDEIALIDRATLTARQKLLKKLVVVLKGIPKAWKQLTEEQQDNVLAEFDRYVIDGIRDIVVEIAGHTFPKVIGQLDQVVVKDGVKAVVKMGKSIEHLHELIDAEGTAIILMLADASDFTKGERPRGESAQQDLGLEQRIDSAADDAAREQEEEGTRLAEEHAAEIAKQRDEAGCLAQLKEVGFEVTAEEIAAWTIEEITEARACAVALKKQKDGEEVTLPAILVGRFRHGKPGSITDDSGGEL